MTFDLQKFQADALAIIKDAVVGIDSEKRVVFWNAAAESLFGVSQLDALGKPLSSLYTFRWLRACDADDSARDLALHKTWRGEVKIVLRDSRELFVEITTSSIDKDGVAYGMMAILRDITERKKAEQQKEALILELRDALKKVKDLEEIVTICAWSGQVRMDDAWISLEKFLETRFGLRVSHGIAPEIAAKLRRQYNISRKGDG